VATVWRFSVAATAVSMASLVTDKLGLDMVYVQVNSSALTPIFLPMNKFGFDG